MAFFDDEEELRKTFTLTRMDPSKERRRRYDSSVLKELQDFWSVDPPFEIKDVRSDYIVKATLMIEDLYDAFENQEKRPPMIYLTRVAKRWRSLWKAWRSEMETDLRVLLFGLIGQVELLIYYQKKEEENRESSSSSEKRQKNDIMDATMYDYCFQKTLPFYKHFYKRRYSAMLEETVTLLFLRAIEFMIFGGSMHVMNNPIYCQRSLATKDYVAKPSFAERFERIFFYLQVELDLYHQYVIPLVQEDIVFPLDKKIALVSFLFGNTKDHLVMSVEKDLPDLLYSLSINPGEMEQYESEKGAMEKVSTLNVISEYRPIEIDTLSEILESETPLKSAVEETLSRMKKREEEAFLPTTSTPKEPRNVFNTKKKNTRLRTEKVDELTLATCLCMLEYTFAKLYPNTKRFRDRFFVERERVPDRLPILNNDVRRKKRTTPMLVHLFNEVFVWRQGRLLACEDFPTAYLFWLKETVMDKSIRGRPEEGIDLTDQFLLFFPEEKEMCTSLMNVQTRSRRLYESDLIK
jgi:hypothetical protein